MLALASPGRITAARLGTIAPPCLFQRQSLETCIYTVIESLIRNDTIAFHFYITCVLSLAMPCNFTDKALPGFSRTIGEGLSFAAQTKEGAAFMD
jgi:hypothetical protein